MLGGTGTRPGTSWTRQPGPEQGGGQAWQAHVCTGTPGVCSSFLPLTRRLCPITSHRAEPPREPPFSAGQGEPLPGHQSTLAPKGSYPSTAHGEARVWTAHPARAAPQSVRSLGLPSACGHRQGEALCGKPWAPRISSQHSLHWSSIKATQHQAGCWRGLGYLAGQDARAPRTSALLLPQLPATTCPRRRRDGLRCLAQWGAQLRAGGGPEEWTSRESPCPASRINH